MSLKSIYIIILLLSSQIAYAIELIEEYMTEDYPPYNFKNESQKITGIAVDILYEMFIIMGIQDQNINLYTWARGYRLAQVDDKKNVIFSTTKTNARTPMFKWVGPISTTKVAVFCRKDAGVNINNDDDLKKYIYSVLRDDIGCLKLLEKGVADSNLNKKTSFDAMVKLVYLNRNKCFAYETNVTKWLLNKYAYDPKVIENAYTLVDGELYYAFNKSVDDHTIYEHQLALDKLKKNSSLFESIFAKYNASYE
jgi:polar amino acid transport system substrate-binding protein